MNPEAQIVFIHEGDSWYLPYAVHQVQYASPDSKVVLLGKGGYGNITIVPLEEISGSIKAQEFRSRYIHMSTNPESYEQFCFLRWFYLLEYMCSRRVEAVFYLDSDVLLYTSMQEIARESIAMGNKRIRGACLFRYGGTTAGISYWTREGLEDFCQMLLDCYVEDKYLNVLKDIWGRFIKTGAAGGICDMTPLTLFYSADADRIADLTKIGGGVFDCNIHEGANYVEDEYVMHQGMKKIIFKDKLPHFERNDISHSLVRAHALHFQGQAKGYMPLYYTGRSFENKIFTDLKGLSYRLRKNFRMRRG